MTGELRKPQFVVVNKTFAVQLATVDAHTTTEGPFVETLVARDISTDIKQAVGRNKVFIAFVQRTLVHSSDATIHLPTVVLQRHIANIIAQRVQLEIESVFIWRLLVFLPLVLLVANDCFQITRRQIEGVVGNGFVVINLLERQHLSIGLDVGRFRNQFTRFLIALTLDNTRSKMVIA